MVLPEYFLLETTKTILLPPYALKPLVKQIAFIGARSLLVIVVAGLFVGMVIALQFYDTLLRFGSVSLLGSAVGLSLIRELGPVLTALMVIGRSGSAMCAEIGIMRVDNQIDALECMAIDPYRYLFSSQNPRGYILRTHIDRSIHSGWYFWWLFCWRYIVWRQPRLLFSRHVRYCVESRFVYGLF